MKSNKNLAIQNIKIQAKIEQYLAKRLIFSISGNPTFTANRLNRPFDEYLFIFLFLLIRIEVYFPHKKIDITAIACLNGENSNSLKENWRLLPNRRAMADLFTTREFNAKN